MKKLVLAILFLGACGDASTVDAPVPDAVVPDARMPDAQVPDAPPPDASTLACLGQPSATTAPDPVPIAGKVFAVVDYQITPAAGATVVVHRRADDGVLTQATTADDGTFATQAQGGATVSAAPAPASLTYYDDVAKLWDPRLPANTNGYTLLTGASASLTLTASHGAQAYPPRTVVAPAGTLAIAVLSPRR